MELDELKTNWKQADAKKIKNIHIMEVVQQNSHGPVAALKKGFKKQILIMALMPFLLITTNRRSIDNVFTSILFWSYVLLCIGVIIFNYTNYRLAGKMEIMDSSLKTNLHLQIDTIKKRLQLKVISLRIAILFFIALFEIVPYIQHYRMLDKWHALPVAIRLGGYAGLLVLQYLLSKIVYKRKYGRHLDDLKALADEME